MSVVTSIRDYIEILNTQTGAREEPTSLFLIISETWPHLLQMCKNTILYFASFNFLRDNFYQPYLGDYDNGFVKIFFSGLGISDNKLEFFLYGFGNSFFISLPGSIGTLIVLRRIILQGIPAGVAATIGGVLGSCFTMIFVIFGSNFFTYSSTFLDFIFLLGLIIPGYVIFQGLCFSDVRLISAKDQNSLLSIGFIHFILGLCNQSTLFKHLREVTISPYPTRFLGIANKTSGIFYIFGFSIGNIFFALSAFFSIVFLINWWLARSTVHRSRLMKFSENTSVVFLTALSISTFSYYGTDFLLTKSFGFLPNDAGFAQTVLAPSSLFKDPHNLTGVHALYPSNEFSLDPAPFDRPLEKLFRRSILYKQPYFKYRSFEELNYQGEKHWLHRGFRHGSAKPIKTATLPSEKKNLAKGRALLKSLDKAVGWVDENQNSQTMPQFAFTNLAKEEINFDFLHLSSLPQNQIGGNSRPSGLANSPSETTQALEINNFYTETPNNFDFLEQKFKRLFYGQIGLLPGRLPPPSGPFDSQEMAHKRLAFTNPVYKALLSFDIDLFLKRQPPTHSLSADDEHNIFLKRQILERYINTQREYFDKTQTVEKNLFYRLAPSGGYDLWSKPSGGDFVAKQDATISQKPEKAGPKTGKTFDYDVPTNLQQKENFIKSFANQTYKHQFKGTLEVVRQLFAVSLDCPEPSSVAGGGTWDKLIKGGHNFFEDDKGLAMPRPTNPRILKFDQPLYVTSNTRNSSYTKLLKNGPLLNNTKSSLSGHSSIKDFELSQIDKRFTHEELSFFSTGKANQQDQNSFLELSGSSPFYVGWDGERRQLLLTQRYLPRKNALIYNTLNYEESFEKRSSDFAYTKTQNTRLKNKNEKTSSINQPLAQDLASSEPLGPWSSEAPGSFGASEALQQGHGSSALALLAVQSKGNTGQNPLLAKHGQEGGESYPYGANSPSGRASQEQSSSKGFTFTTWPLLKSDPTERSALNWRIPSRSFEHLLALEEEARMGLDEPSDKTKGIRGSYDRFVELWNNYFSHGLPQQTPPFKISRWPTNITTPSVQTDLDTFDQVETALFTGIKRGGFIWPGGRDFKFFKN